MILVQQLVLPRVFIVALREAVPIVAQIVEADPDGEERVLRGPVRVRGTRRGCDFVAELLHLAQTRQHQFLPMVFLETHLIIGTPHPVRIRHSRRYQAAVHRCTAVCKVVGHNIRCIVF